MCPDWTGPRGDDSDDDSPSDRPYGTKPYGTKPYGTKPYGTKPYGTKPYGTKPYGTKPYGTKPYATKPYGTKSDDPDFLDPDEWSEDIAEMFCMDSAVIRLGARVVTDTGDISVLSTEPLEGTPGYVARSAETYSKAPPGEDPDDWDTEPTTIELRGKKERAGLAKRVLKPQEHELAVKVVLPDELVRSLADSPEIAWALKQDIAHGLAVAADQAFLQGDPVDPAPVGITRTPAVTPYPHPGDVLQIARGMVGEIRRRDQVRFGNAGWVLHPFWLDALTRLLTDDFQQQGPGIAMDARGSDRLLSSDGHDGGLLLGFPFVVTAAAVGGGDLVEDEDPRAWIYFSADWSEAWVGAAPGLIAVDISFESRFGSDETVVRAVLQHDFLLRRPKFFIYRAREASPVVFDEPGIGANLKQVVLPAVDDEPLRRKPDAEKPAPKKR